MSGAEIKFNYVPRVNDCLHTFGADNSLA